MAAAQERQLIEGGCQLHIAVEEQTSPVTGQDKAIISQAVLRLQVVKKGEKHMLDLPAVTVAEKSDSNMFSNF